MRIIVSTEEFSLSIPTFFAVFVTPTFSYCLLYGFLEPGQCHKLEDKKQCSGAFSDGRVDHSDQAFLLTTTRKIRLEKWN